MRLQSLEDFRVRGIRAESIPPFTDRWTEDPVGIGTARHPYVRLNDSSPSAGPHLLQARIVSGDVWLVTVLIVFGMLVFCFI